MSLPLDLGRREFIDPPDPPDAAALEQLRAAFCSLPRISEAWVHGERYTKEGLPPHELTVISLVLDPPLREKDLSETEDLLEAMGDYSPKRSPNHSVAITKPKDFYKRNGTRCGAERIYKRAPDGVVDYEREFKREAWVRRSVWAAAIAVVLIGVMALPVESLGWERFLVLMTPVWLLAALLGVWAGSRD